ncbi:MAG: hypothetical protein WED05_10045 [Candidatus Atabeyarchaeum deiterrae]
MVRKGDLFYPLFSVIAVSCGAYVMLQGSSSAAAVMVLFIVCAVTMPFMRRFVKDRRVGCAGRYDNWYLALTAVPIALRFGMFGLTLSWAEDFTGFTMLIVVAWSEETFRAGVAGALMKAGLGLGTSIVVANGPWLVLHFALRAFVLSYAWWLLVAGACLSAILWKCGVGKAVLGHIVVNLTA